MKKLLLSAASAVGLAIGSASAATVTHGETTVTVLFDVMDNGLTASATGDADVEFDGDGQPVFEFLITGDELNDDLTGTLSHTGGARFETGGTFVELSNFTLDLSKNEVLADVSASGGVSLMQANVFDILRDNPVVIPTGDPFDDIDNQGFTFVFEELTINLLGDLFGPGLDFTSGDAFASAAVDPTGEVPVPAAAFLFAPALAGIYMRRRKQAAA